MHRARTAPERLGDRTSSAHFRNATRVASGAAGTLAAVISVVVPVHDEEHSVEPLFDELTEALAPLGTPWEVVFVDDGSTDGTFARLSRLTTSTTTSASSGCGATSARRQRSRPASPSRPATIVVTIDGDLQDDPHEIPRLLAKLDEGFDLVSGWKTHRRDPLSRAAFRRRSSTRSRGGCPAFGCTT